jgi:hypothetical protein
MALSGVANRQAQARTRMGYMAGGCNEAWRKMAQFHVSLFPVRDVRPWLAPTCKHSSADKKAF